MPLQDHWNSLYQKAQTDRLGWYESLPQPSLDLIEACGLPKDARIFHAGAGASTLVDALLEAGYSGQIACDISAEALQKVQDRLGAEAGKVAWIVDDLTQPAQLKDLAPVHLWHDRAVLHFFTEEKDQQTYFDLLRQLLQPGGYAILATYNLRGVERCAGLPVKRYDASLLTEKLGPGFQLRQAFDFTYHMPSGEERPYVYTVFQR
ncbi:MAG: class I SAM-dependent methyltransferase [Lewinellaceae bacterium]|nr:class I SAM-dependent methyltransferase [Lewinellaceae bacterium]